MARCIAVDIDLHRVHAWDDTRKEVVCVDNSAATLLGLLATDNSEPITLLVECGSVVTYGDKLLMKKQAWMLYNMYIVGLLTAYISSNEALHHVTMYISPSSKWTKGWPETRRHMLAGAEDEPTFTKDQNHNIKECQAMAWMHAAHPELWLPPQEYMKCL